PPCPPVTPEPQQFQNPAPTAPVQQPVQTQQFQEPTAPVSAQEAPQQAEYQNPSYEPVQFKVTTINQDDLGEYNQPEPPKPMFDAICDMCAEEIQIPFQPDGKRPTFCKDCLKEYQRMNAKEKLNQERKMQREQEERLEQNPQPEQYQAPAQPQQQPQPYRSQQTQAPRPQYQRRSTDQPRQQQPQQSTEKRFEQKAYISKDRPMSLSQMTHIAPKKFNPQRERPKVNLDEVRSMINDTRSANNQN
ncbi:MAG: hypothetical protein ACD_67C00037G0001, partial [uncultured bacterium]